MNVLLWMLFGAISAWIASIIAGANNQQKVIGSVALGVIGAVVAGYVMQTITGHIEGGLNYYSLLVAVGGSLLIVALFSHKKA